MSTIYRSSRRTVMTGEVVTFAPMFGGEELSVFGKYYRPLGSYEITASREAVVVEGATLRSAEECAAFARAITYAEEVRLKLALQWGGGYPSQYPEEPVLVFIDEEPQP